MIGVPCVLGPCRGETVKLDISDDAASIQNDHLTIDLLEHEHGHLVCGRFQYLLLVQCEVFERAFKLDSAGNEKHSAVGLLIFMTEFV